MTSPASASMPQPSDRNASQAPQIVASMAVLAALASTSVCLRLLARRLKRVVLGGSDYLLLLALPVSLALAIVSGIATQYGMGKHLLTLTPAEVTKELKLLLATQILWAVATTLVKLSILSLYNYIFDQVRYLRWAVLSLITFTVLWVCSVCIVLGLQCRPIQFLWDKKMSGECINTSIFFISASSLDVVTGFIILILPAHPIWQLQIPVSKKLLIMVIFAIGSLTCIISLVRVIEVAHSLAADADVTWAITMPTIWSAAEPCLGIVCACLPTIRPLLQLMGKSIKRITTRNSASNDTSYGTSKSRKSATEDSTKLVPPSPAHNVGGFRYHNSTIEATASSDAGNADTCELRDKYGRGTFDQIYSLKTINVERR